MATEEHHCARPGEILRPFETRKKNIDRIYTQTYRETQWQAIDSVTWNARYSQYAATLFLHLSMTLYILHLLNEASTTASRNAGETRDTSKEEDELHFFLYSFTCISGAHLKIQIFFLGVFSSSSSKDATCAQLYSFASSAHHFSSI